MLPVLRTQPGDQLTQAIVVKLTKKSRVHMHAHVPARMHACLTVHPNKLPGSTVQLV